MFDKFLIFIFLLCTLTFLSKEHTSFSNFQNDPWNNGVLFFGIDGKYNVINETFGNCIGFNNCTNFFYNEFSKMENLIWMLLQFISTNEQEKEKKIFINPKNNLPKNEESNNWIKKLIRPIELESIFNNGALLCGFSGSIKPNLETIGACFNNTDCSNKIYETSIGNPQTVFSGFSLPS